MSPRTPKQFAEIREEKRTLIMDTALQHFANEGYFATTIDHIARHAGISKGLMYNYFDSKEALLRAIIQRSASEAFNYFDIDRDGYLSEEEFEIFVRQTAKLLREKKSFWRLLIQLLMQNEVRKTFIELFSGHDDKASARHDTGDILKTGEIMKIISDYFARKKSEKDPGYDPALEMEFFLISLKGYAVTCVYNDEENIENDEKLVSRIIAGFK